MNVHSGKYLSLEFRGTVPHGRGVRPRERDTPALTGARAYARKRARAHARTLARVHVARAGTRACALRVCATRVRVHSAQAASACAWARNAWARVA